MTSFAIDKLSPAERLDLIGQLWDSLDEIDTPMTAAQRAELDRRLDGADSGDGKTWAQVMADLKRGRD